MPAALVLRSIARSPLDSLTQCSMLFPMICSMAFSPNDIALFGHDPTPRLVAAQPLPPSTAYTLGFLPPRLQCLVSQAGIPTIKYFRAGDVTLADVCISITRSQALKRQ